MKFRISGKTSFTTQGDDPVINTRLNMEYVPQLRPGPPGSTQLQMREGNAAVISMAIKRRSLALRHVARTPRVRLYLWFESVDAPYQVV